VNIFNLGYFSKYFKCMNIFVVLQPFFNFLKYILEKKQWTGLFPKNQQQKRKKVQSQLGHGPTSEPETGLPKGKVHRRANEWRSKWAKLKQPDGCAPSRQLMRLASNRSAPSYADQVGRC
jgi:hypothetical protein